MPGVAAYLRIVDLPGKLFNRFTALRGISLEVYPGEFVCFLGPSGCGETTLARAIAGLDIQTAGRVFQAGRDLRAAAGRSDFGIVVPVLCPVPQPQDPAQRRLRPREPASGARRIRRIGWQSCSIWSALRTRATSTCAQLSGGQQQRVALARARDVAGPASA